MMNQQKQISNRIKNRRENKKEKKFFLKIINRMLAIICLILAFLIYAYKDPNGKTINSLFGTNFNFTNINLFINKISSSLNSFLNINNKENSLEVSGKINFINTSEYHYTNSDSKVYSIGKGTITSINETNEGFTISLNLEQGYTAIYEKIEYVVVKNLDCVELNSVLGYFTNEFKLSILKDGSIYTYEEIGTFN